MHIIPILQFLLILHVYTYTACLYTKFSTVNIHYTHVTKHLCVKEIIKTISMERFLRNVNNL